MRRLRVLGESSSRSLLITVITEADWRQFETLQNISRAFIIGSVASQDCGSWRLACCLCTKVLCLITGGMKYFVCCLWRRPCNLTGRHKPGIYRGEPGKEEKQYSRDISPHQQGNYCAKGTIDNIIGAVILDKPDKTDLGDLEAKRRRKCSHPDIPPPYSGIGYKLIEKEKNNVGKSNAY